MARVRRYADVCLGLPVEHLRRIESIAQASGTNKSHVFRQIVTQYINSLDSEKKTAQESVLEKRLQKLENRLANLTVLATRASAQSLYYMTLPFSVGGLPQKPLKKEALKKYWKESRHFASDFLKNALIPPAGLADSDKATEE